MNSESSPLSTYVGHNDIVYTVRPIDRNQVLSGSGDGTVKLWDMRTSENISSSSSYNSAIHSLSIERNGFIYSIGLGDNRVIVFDMRKDCLLKEVIFKLLLV